MGINMDYMNQRQELCNICTLLFERGLVCGTDGNMSLRLENDKMLITPSGICKGFLKPEMLLVQDFNGNLLCGSGNLRPTKEAAMHSAYYLARNEVGAVLHTHSPYTTAFAACALPVPTNVVIELTALIGATAVSCYAPPGSELLVSEVKKYVDSNVILLANHGVLVVGKDLTDAFVKHDMLENAAKTIINAKRLGCISPFEE